MELREDYSILSQPELRERWKTGLFYGDASLFLAAYTLAWYNREDFIEAYIKALEWGLKGNPELNQIISQLWHNMPVAERQTITTRLHAMGYSPPSAIVITTRNVPPLECVVEYSEIKPGDRYTRCTWGHVFSKAVDDRWYANRPRECAVCKAPVPPVVYQETMESPAPYEAKATTVRYRRAPAV